MIFIQFLDVFSTVPEHKNPISPPCFFGIDVCMDHSLPLISTLAIAFGLAIGFGYIAERCRFPALVGYLVAGIMAGKHTWGPVADMNVASQLMEVGVMLLMFG